MYGLTIDITDTVTRDLSQFADNLNTEALKAAAGGSVKRLLQDHFQNLDTRGNKLDGRRTHYFADAARSISYETDPDGVTISIHQLGIGLHYFGGTITPVNTKYLTIPARSEAHGRRAGEFNNLEILWGRKGPYALAERQSQEIKIRKRKGQTKLYQGAERGGAIFFWLVKSATIKPNEETLPPEEEIMDTAIQAMLKQLGS
jgi:hypothetical protein